jgi:hypothetical protein
MRRLEYLDDIFFLSRKALVTHFGDELRKYRKPKSQSVSL